MLYKSCCPATGNHIITLSAEGKDHVDKLIKSIYDDKAIPDMDAGLAKAYGGKLGNAVVEGYGADLAGVDWNSPDYATISALQNNVWQFSAAKTRTQLIDFGKALIGPDGKIRSFDDFQRAAQQITDEQLRWLRTEYDTTVAGAQMAAKWQRIQAEKDTFPMLEFDAVLDSHSSTICPPLDKVRKPVDHPFWLKWYPPNHFNCRSTVRQLTEGEETPDDQIVYPEKISPMFAGNVGVSGIIFPKDHPYYEGVEPHIVDNATLYMPEEEQYLITYEPEKGDGGVTVNRKTLIADKPDLEQLQQAAEALANAGKKVEILPEIHAAESALRDELLPDAKPNKNPDMRVDGNYTEVKAPGAPLSVDKLEKAISKGIRQANDLVILLEEDFDKDALKSAAENRFNLYPELDNVGFVTIDGEYVEFKNDKRQKK
ncbi:phage minor head protein [Mucilaginibacter ximonensis]|uniref:Phage minor head protein n=1 Tax=Mucilaginibacter ximonensis TaxID=538021 RepID=A0ABW5YFK2_9SPHI